MYSFSIILFNNAKNFPKQNILLSHDKRNSHTLIFLLSCHDISYFYLLTSLNLLYFDFSNMSISMDIYKYITLSAIEFKNSWSCETMNIIFLSLLHSLIRWDMFIILQ